MPWTRDGNGALCMQDRLVPVECEGDDPCNGVDHSCTDMKRDAVAAEIPSAAQEMSIQLVVENRRPERLDRVLSRVDTTFLSLSREKIKQAILDGSCLVDGTVCQEPARKIRNGQQVTLNIAFSSSPLEPSPNPVAVVHEDEDIAVINKPAGLTVHPCPSCNEETLIQRLLWRFPQLKNMGGLRPGIVHRLDKDTSGLMVIALSERARLPLVQAFAERTVRKTYLALVKGIAPESGQCAEPIGRHPVQKIKMAVVPAGRCALTEWKRLYASEDGAFSLLALQIHTGRTHQIRVHMQRMGHPLWGDELYGTPLSGYGKQVSFKEEATVASRQMLHAWRLQLAHPISGEQLDLASPPPDDFWQGAVRLHERMSKAIITGCPGCGKSALSRALIQRGVPVWSADEEVRRLYAPHGEIASILRQRYGTRFVNEDGTVNKASLLHAMKEENGFRGAIESIVHPMVKASREAFFAEKERQGIPLAFAEVPLWFEAQEKAAPETIPAKDNLYVVGVACDTAIRHARLANKRGWSAETIAVMDSWQWPEQKKLASCDLVVPNNSTLEALQEAASALHDTLMKDIQKRRTAWLQGLQRIVANHVG